MGKKLKIFLMILGSLFGLAIIALLILFIFVKAIETTGTRMLESAYSDEDIVEYVEDTHDIEVRILENEGRVPGGFGGLPIEDARVETLDEDKTEFSIHISVFGNITGDDYEDVLARSELNEALVDSSSYHELQELGFTDMQFGENESEHSFSMSLPEDLSIHDEESLKKMYQAIPSLTKLQDKAQKKDVDMDRVHVDQIKVDLQDDYASWEDFADKIANENIEDYAAPYVEKVENNMEVIEEDLHDLHFNTERAPKINCLEMDGYDECGSYSLSLQADKDKEGNTTFVYDDDESKQHFIDAMGIINDAGLSFDQVSIESVYRPDEEKDQDFTQEELEEREGYTHFVTGPVEIENVHEVSNRDDIYFLY